MASKLVCALAVALGVVTAQPALGNGSAAGSQAGAAATVIDLAIALAPEDRGRVERTLYDVSDPAGPRYGQHLTRDEAKALLRPRPESVEAVRRWLSESGVPDDGVADGGQLVHARLSAALVERLRSTRLGRLSCDGAGAAGTFGCSVPAGLRAHVVVIQATAARGARPDRRLERRTRRRGAVAAEALDGSPAACNGTSTPRCLRQLYRMGGSSSRPHARSLLGIAGFDGQAAQHGALAEYLRRFADYAAGADFSTELVDGGANPQGEVASGEADLDVQLAVAMAYPVPVRFYATGGDNRDFVPDLDLPDARTGSIESWLPLVSHLVDADDGALPPVLSVSYGVNEQAVPRPYAEFVCDMLGQLGARGVSVVASAGDAGPGSSCRASDGSNATRFLPSFPATCPFVTAVGATAAAPAAAAAAFSSGGFSDLWPRPAWQDAAVAGYVDAHGARWRGYYNPLGRAFPDVAVLGEAYPIVHHGKLQMANGTSASAPVFASMVALLNDRRLHRGQPPMGFLNPWLYGIGRRAFTDIVLGRSTGCAGRSLGAGPAPRIPGAGWDAVPGWDPVTGLGTPLFDRLERLAST